MLKVLIIEDDDSVARTVVDAVRDRIPDAKILIEGSFDAGKQKLVEHRPDVVILDLIEGDQTTGERKGDQIWKDIWSQQFRPVVIYSALELPFDLPDTPFVDFVQKGKGSDLVVAERVEALKPYIDALRGVDEEILSVVRHVLKTLARQIFDQEPDNEHNKKEMLIRAVRRRVAAMMDEGLVESDEPMHGWEQYLVPAFGQHLLTADILLKVGAVHEVPSSYVVVLTPSCDMFINRANCVEKVLVAKCHGVEKYLKAINLKAGTKPKTIADNLPKNLTQAHVSGKVLLPEYPGAFPMMTLDLRDLDLIDRNKVGDPGGVGTVYERVASIDSPFREQIAWAFHQDSGRPGLPERSFHAVIEAVIAATTQDKEVKK